MFFQTPPPPPPRPMPVTIFVHGTQPHALISDTDLSQWLIPETQTPQGLTALSSLEKDHKVSSIMHALSKSDGKQFPFEAMYSFGWKGSNVVADRKQAADSFCECMKQFKQSYEELHGDSPVITVITHSHAGNVMMHAAEKENSFIIDRLILMGCPVQERTVHAIAKPMFRKIYSFFSPDDIIQIADQQLLQEVRAAFNDIFEGATLQKGQKLIQTMKTNFRGKNSERVFGSQSNLIQAQTHWHGIPPASVKADKSVSRELAAYPLLKLIFMGEMSNASPQRGLMHTEFTTDYFFSRIPFLLKKMDQLFLNHHKLQNLFHLFIDEA